LSEVPTLPPAGIRAVGPAALLSQDQHHRWTNGEREARRQAGSRVEHGFQAYAGAWRESPLACGNAR
jgi:hypothetical protein